MEVPEYVDFGKYKESLSFIDQKYNDICTKIINLARQSRLQPDPYERSFNGVELLEFAVHKDFTDKDIDFIYKQFVYEKLARYTKDTVEELELFDLINEFQVIND